MTATTAAHYVQGETQIALERVVRDCPRNRETNDPRQIIYDFEVKIDGYVRAIWKRIVGGKGYEIETLDRDPIAMLAESDYYRNRAFITTSKATMLDDTRSLLINGRIPTAQDMEARRQGEDRALALAQEEELEQARKHAISKFTMELYEIARSPLSAGPRIDVLSRIDVAIAESQAHTRIHGESFHNENGYFEADRIWPFRY